MSQDSVHKILKKHRRWMSVKEISRLVKVNERSVCCNLRKLFKWNVVERKRVFQDHGSRYDWRIK